MSLSTSTRLPPNPWTGYLCLIGVHTQTGFTSSLGAMLTSSGCLVVSCLFQHNVMASFTQLTDLSGMHLARVVLEAAQQDCQSSEQDFQADRNTSPEYLTHVPPIPQPASFDPITPPPPPSPSLPPLEVTMDLIDTFFIQYLIPYPILVPREFTREVKRFYERGGGKAYGSEADPWTIFELNMVLTISFAHLSRENPKAKTQSKDYSTCAMTHLNIILRSKNHRTVQCLLLLLLSSILNSTSAPTWYISGLCIRLIVDLGFHSERTIHLQGRREATSEEIDTKRRLFWVAYTFDRTLATMLGRPFILDDDKIDVRLPWSSLPEDSRPSILHWVRLQRLQSEIVQRLYMTKDPLSSASTSTGEVGLQVLAQWREQMLESLDIWMDMVSTMSTTNPHDINWWRYWYHNAVLALHRPLPSIQQCDDRILSIAYNSAKEMVHLSFIRYYRGATHTSWVDAHCQLMSGITLLFLVLKSPLVKTKVRNEKTSFKSCLVEWQYVIKELTARWDSMARMRDVTRRLAETVMDMVEKDSVQDSNADGGDDTRRSVALGSTLYELIPSHHPVDNSRLSVPYQDRAYLSGSASAAEVAMPWKKRWNTSVQPSSSNVFQSLPADASTSSLISSEDPTQRRESWLNLKDYCDGAFDDWNSALQGNNSGTGVSTFDSGSSKNINEVINEANSDVWSGLRPSCPTMQQPIMGIWDYLQLPLTGSEGVGYPLGALSGTVPIDAVFTDSVLNFGSTWMAE